jgi:1-acyl-sn-glycerol-3-phosphate acyltransferase
MVAPNGRGVTGGHYCHRSAVRPQGKGVSVRHGRRPGDDRRREALRSPPYFVVMPASSESSPLAAIKGMLRMAAATAEDALATVDLLGITGAAGPPPDPFDARDPDYIRETLPALRTMSRLYFRADVTGLERIPASGPVLLIGNHSGGIMIADTFVFAQAFYDHFGADRRFNQLAHDLVFKAAGPRTLVQRYGTVPASPENMTRALHDDAALLVYPGGDEETFRPSWETGEVHFAHRTGFVRLALEHGVPIVPVVAVGGQETGLFLGPDTRLAKALRLDRLARLKVLPLVIGPPFGVTVLDFPGRIPLPSKITIRVMPPIDLCDELGRDPDIEAGYRLVKARMQRTLTRLNHERRIPIVG